MAEATKYAGPISKGGLNQARGGSKKSASDSAPSKGDSNRSFPGDAGVDRPASGRMGLSRDR